MGRFILLAFTLYQGDTMKKKLMIMAVGIFVVTAGGFYYLSGKQFVVRVPERKIKEIMAEKLPMTKSYLFIFEVTLSNPRVNLANGTDRINAGLDVTLNIKINDEKKQLGGSIDILGGIKYSQNEGEFFLKDPQIVNLSVQGLPKGLANKATIVLEKALKSYYSTHPIYRLKTSDMKQATARLILKNIVVDNKDLVITLGI